MFYKCKMLDAGNGCLYDFVIIEAEHPEDAYDRAIGHLPQLLGESDEDSFPVVVEHILNEPWPIFTESYFIRVQEEREARYSKRA